VHHKAVEALVVGGNEVWDRVVCFGNDAVHSFVRQALQDELPIPDLQDAKFWNCAFGYTIKRSTYARDQKETKIVERFRIHYDTFFNDHDTLRPGFHDNFTESMGTLEATANKKYNSWETLNDHLIMYLRGKYQLKCKKWARALAYRIVAKEPLNFSSLWWYYVSSVYWWCYDDVTTQNQNVSS